jgi:uncharacterized membrane protein
VVDEGEEEGVITFHEFMKFLHITFAIVAVGFNASYGVWLARAGRQPEHQAYVLRGIKILDDRFANPAYGLLLVTGLIMVATSPFELTTFWIALGLALYALAILIGALVYTPTLRKQIRTLEDDGPDLPRVPAVLHPGSDRGDPAGRRRHRHRVPYGDEADPLISRG